MPLSRIKAGHHKHAGDGKDDEKQHESRLLPPFSIAIGTDERCHSTVRRTISMCDEMNVWDANLRNFHGRAVGVQRLLTFFLGKCMPFCC